MGRRASFFAAVSLALFWQAASAQEIALQHGARLVFEENEALGRYALPAGSFDGSAVPAEVIEGALRREVWRIDTNSLTNAQLAAPIRADLQAQDFEILLDCADRTCGGFDFRFETEVVPSPAMYVDLTDFRFLSARNADGAVGVLISGTEGARLVQIIRVGAASLADIVRAAPPPEPRATGPLAETLETLGRVVLDDVAFETGSTALSDGSYASLDALASYLKANPDRRVAVVGHTDAVGGIDGNIAISRQRAQSVVDRLARTHGIPVAQMEAGGMGYLAPLRSNLTEEGRAANRRVEAVLISTE